MNSSSICQLLEKCSSLAYLDGEERKGMDREGESERGIGEGTIEAIGKYQMISSPPIIHYTIVPIIHVS